MCLISNGEHDDLADSMTQAILRFRQGGFIITPLITMKMNTVNLTGNGSITDGKT